MKDLEQRKNLIDGEYTGNLLVCANSVMLKNMIINGSLMSAVVQRIGQSPLDNWTITGGGTNAVSMNSGTNMKTLIVCCVDRPIKVFFDKDSTAAVKEKIKVSVTKNLYS